MLRCLKQDSVEGKTIVVSGSGNVAIYAVEKAQALGGRVIAMSDSQGYIVDEGGIRLDVVKQIKEVERGRIREYAERGARGAVCGRLPRDLVASLRYRASLRHAE